jgi:hypothetical protein
MFEQEEKRTRLRGRCGEKVDDHENELAHRSIGNMRRRRLFKNAHQQRKDIKIE